MPVFCSPLAFGSVGPRAGGLLGAGRGLLTGRGECCGGVGLAAGGSGGDPRHTEGDAGRDYLIQQGVAAGTIVSETRSETTWESVQAVAKILRERNARTCVAVSDGFHLYRIKLMFRSVGITTFASPAPESPIEADSFLRTMHSLREMLIVTLWRVGIRS